MTTETAPETTTAETKTQLFVVDSRVQVNAPESFPEVSGMLATVLSYDSFWNEYKVLLDNIPAGYEYYSWDTRTWTLPAGALVASDSVNPDPRPWPRLSRMGRVIFKDSRLIGTIHAIRPTEDHDADYKIALDNGRKVFAQESEVEEFTEEWKFNGIIHRVRVTPDNSGREGGGWLFMVNAGLNDSIGWVRADAAQALARMILGLEPATDDERHLSAREDY